MSAEELKKVLGNKEYVNICKGWSEKTAYVTLANGETVIVEANKSVASLREGIEIGVGLANQLVKEVFEKAS